VPSEGSEEDERREENAHEGREERVRRRLEEAAAPAIGRITARDRRVDDEPERHDERGRAEPRHQ
jgi:hypothetical protein